MSRIFGFCSRFQGYLVKKTASGFEVYHGRCKMWSCPECSQLLRSKWRSHLALRIEALGGKWSFVTITAPSYFGASWAECLRESAKLFKTQMNNVLQFLRRCYGKIQYIRVLEIQKRGAIHAHLLINFWFPLPSLRSIQKGKNKGRMYHPELKRFCVEHGFGSHIDIELLTGSPLQASIYITKYITKESRNFEEWLPKNTRYIQCSQGIGALNLRVKSEDEWSAMDGKVIGSLVRQNVMFWDADNKMREITWFDLDDNFEWNG